MKIVISKNEQYLNTHLSENRRSLEILELHHPH